MPTRQGTSYNNMADSNENPTSTLIQQMAQLIDLVATLGNRIQALEQTQPERVQAIIQNEPDQPGRDTTKDNRVLRNVRVDAPIFDGTLDPINLMEPSIQSNF